MKPTNIVLITLDTVRADHLHCYENAKIKTPTIDALANSGVLFEKAVAQAPLTLPSHTSMFTGTNPNVHHVRDTGGFVLQPSSVTMATILREHGWKTAAFVVAVVLKRAFGFNQGFSVYDDRMPGGSGGEVMMRNAGITMDHALAWLNSQPRQSSQPFLSGCIFMMRTSRTFRRRQNFNVNIRAIPTTRKSLTWTSRLGAS